MTWHTSWGDRYLTGCEAKLFRAALHEALEALETNDLDCTDTLLEVQTKTSKLHLFALVGKYLLQPTSDFPPLNAWTEGAVGVIFGCLANSLDAEIEAESETDKQTDKQTHHWRDMLLAAAREKGWKHDPEAENPLDASKPERLEAADWHLMLEFLEEQILWDMDWAADPFGSLAGAFDHEQESYFQWCHRSALDTHAAIELLGELCGYRRDRLEGDEVI